MDAIKCLQRVPRRFSHLQDTIRSLIVSGRTVPLLLPLFSGSPSGTEEALLCTENSQQPENQNTNSPYNIRGINRKEAEILSVDDFMFVMVMLFLAFSSLRTSRFECTVTTAFSTEKYFAFLRFFGRRYHFIF